MSLSVKHTDGDAGSAETTRLLPALATGWVLLILAIAVVLLRLVQLSEAPPGFFFDEGAHGLDALRVLKGEHAVFFSGNNGREGLVVYAAALSIASLGRTPLAIRLPTALASASTVFAVFWLGQLLFGRDESGRATPWRGLLPYTYIAARFAPFLFLFFGLTCLFPLANISRQRITYRDTTVRSFCGCGRADCRSDLHLLCVASRVIRCTQQTPLDLQLDS